MTGIASIVALALLVAAAPAGARNVATEIVTGEQPHEVRELGAVGVYVPGRGLYVSRQEALERLGPLPQAPCGSLERCPYEVFVSVPPLAAQRNLRPHDVTILGGEMRGLLVSPNTRIDGLLSIEDVRDTVAALEAGREPEVEWRASADPLGELDRLQERIAAAREAQLPANLALTLVLIALVAAALLTRSALLARTALLYPLLAILLALGGSGADVVGAWTTTALMLLAAPAAAALAATVALTLAVPLGLAVYGLALALFPETNALMAIGPHPWSGGRFYGVTNQVETLLLAPALAAATLFRGWRLGATAVLALLVVGASKTGADGGGILVYAAAFATLWVLLERRRAWPLALAGAVAAAVVFVALDAVSGGSSHVVEAVTEGPRELLDTFRLRAEASVAIATSTVWQLGALLAGVAVLAWLAALTPRFAAVDALLVGLAVSLVVNDSPTKVAGYGAIVCGALRAWSVSRERRVE